MGSELIPAIRGTADICALLPALISREGQQTSKRFLEFFTVNIRNPNTRLAYAKGVGQFLAWCDERRQGLQDIEPMIVAAYVEQLTQERAPQTVKQHLAAIRMLFDWLVIGQVVSSNPASSVRGPRYSIKKGKTPVLSAADARRLLDSIETGHVVGLRDRALIGLMVYSFARVSAVVKMTVSDYYRNGKRYWIRLHEKGGKFHEVPVHHTAEEYLDAYVEAAGIDGEKSKPLFRTTRGRTRELTARALDRFEAHKMIKRRAAEADVACPLFTNGMFLLRQQFPIRSPLLGVKSSDMTISEFLEQARAIKAGASAVDEGRDSLALSVGSQPSPALSLLLLKE
jgi:integrase/recombinase XerD